MGNTCTSMTPSISGTMRTIKRRIRGKIIDEKQLIAVQQCIEHLKERLFINYGSRIRVRAITAKIQYGDAKIIDFLRKFASPRECATALNNFLRDIRKPLLSRRTQNLVLASNYGICPRIIALDALSLLADDLAGPERDLFMAIMDLMQTLSTIGCLKPTEVRVSHAPYLLMPLLFPFTGEVQQIIAKNWKSVADILNEMVLSFNFFLDNGHFKPDSPIFTAKKWTDTIDRLNGQHIARTFIATNRLQMYH